MQSSQSEAKQDIECPPQQGEGSFWADLGFGALQDSPGFWESFLILLFHQVGCGERSSCGLPWDRAVLCAWHRVILLCLHPVGAAATQTLLVLRALTGLCAHGNAAEVMLCLLPVLTCTSLIQVLLVVPLLG